MRLPVQPISFLCAILLQAVSADADCPDPPQFHQDFIRDAFQSEESKLSSRLLKDQKGIFHWRPAEAESLASEYPGILFPIRELHELLKTPNSHPKTISSLFTKIHRQIMERLARQPRSSHSALKEFMQQKIKPLVDHYEKNGMKHTQPDQNVQLNGLLGELDVALRLKQPLHLGKTISQIPELANLREATQNKIEQILKQHREVGYYSLISEYPEVFRRFHYPRDALFTRIQSGSFDQRLILAENLYSELKQRGQLETIERLTSQFIKRFAKGPSSHRQKLTRALAAYPQEFLKILKTHNIPEKYFPLDSLALSETLKDPLQVRRWLKMNLDRLMSVELDGIRALQKGQFEIIEVKMGSHDQFQLTRHQKILDLLNLKNEHKFTLYSYRNAKDLYPEAKNGLTLDEILYQLTEAKKFRGSDIESQLMFLPRQKRAILTSQLEILQSQNLKPKYDGDDWIESPIEYFIQNPESSSSKLRAAARNLLDLYDEDLNKRLRPEMKLLAQQKNLVEQLKQIDPSAWKSVLNQDPNYLSRAKNLLDTDPDHFFSRLPESDIPTYSIQHLRYLLKNNPARLMDSTPRLQGGNALMRELQQKVTDQFGIQSLDPAVLKSAILSDPSILDQILDTGAEIQWPIHKMNWAELRAHIDPAELSQWIRSRLSAPEILGAGKIEKTGELWTQDLHLKDEFGEYTLRLPFSSIEKLPNPLIKKTTIPEIKTLFTQAKSDFSEHQVMIDQAEKVFRKTLKDESAKMIFGHPNLIRRVDQEHFMVWENADHRGEFFVMIDSQAKETSTKKILADLSFLKANHNSVTIFPFNTQNHSPLLPKLRERNYRVIHSSLGRHLP